MKWFAKKIKRLIHQGLSGRATAAAAAAAAASSSDTAEATIMTAYIITLLEN